MIVAVLGRHARLALGSADVFVNVAGGVRIDEPGADLAVALAIASAATRRAGAGRTRRVRRARLTGRLRPATQAERRLEECAKLGFAAVLAPKGTPPRPRPAVSRSRPSARRSAAGLEAAASEK